MIGLVGAPGSGKSTLAKLLADYFDGEAVVVDKYLAKVRRDFNIELGMYATYFGNVAVAMARVGAERLAQKKGATHIITCGTHIDSVTYASINAFLEQAGEEVPQQGRIANTMRFVGMLAQDTFGYDHVFYLPTEGQDSFGKRINDELAVALETFGVSYAKLTPGKHLEQAVAHMEWVRETSEQAKASQEQ